MKMIVCKIFFFSLWLYWQLNLLKAVIFRLEFRLKPSWNKPEIPLIQISTSVKRSEKQLPSKANFSLFYNLIALIMGHKSVQDLRVTKIVKEIKFVKVSGELESIRGLQRQSFTKYLVF